MARDSKYDILFEPIKIGPKTSPNRFYKAPHCTALGVERPGAQAYFRSTATEGGWGVVNTEYCSIHPESDDTPYVSSRLWDDGDVHNLALMCQRIHDHGGLAGVQLWYGSKHALNYETRMAPRGVSQIPSDYVYNQSCRTMSKQDIRELQGFYVAAAKRARAAGFDIVNVYGGHTHSIPHQFLEPFYNKRTDEYGGSLENRARFWLETLEMVRDAIGDECAISCRFGVDTLRGESGISAEEDGVGFIKLADHLVDIWDFTIGNLEWGEDAGPSRFFKENHQRPFIEIVKPHVTKPVVGVGRFTSPDVMVELIKSGHLDMIGAARPSIADPFLPRKIQEGRVDDIRECIGCNFCVSRWAVGAARISCTQNATAGEEYRRGWHPEKFSQAKNADKDVLIVGGGPAGMECARVLGNRGFKRIHLVEADRELGGIMRWIPRLPGLGDWGRVFDYRKVQLDKLKNVTIVPGSKLSVDDVREYGADIVVVATGAHWAKDGLNNATHEPIPGADASLDHCLTPEQIMLEGKKPTGPKVVIYDCEGYFMGSTLAEKLAREGHEVTLVTPLHYASAFAEYTLEHPRVMRTLHKLGVNVISEHTIDEIQPGQVKGTHVYDEEHKVTWQADSVVLVTCRVSDESLFRELESDPDALEREGIEAIYRVGDCVIPRLIADAVFDGHRLAREIDSPNPAVPLPYIREYRILGRSDAEYDQVIGDNNDVESISSQVDLSLVAETDQKLK